MKKLSSIFIGLLMFCSIVVGFKFHMNNQIIDNKAGLRDYRSQERYSSSEAQKLMIDDNTLVIFGSSELASLSNYNDNVSSFLNGEQMNVMTVGEGYFQSLFHTMALGSLEDAITSKKVAFFLSPQWFSENGYSSSAFSSRFSENLFLDFLNNSKISRESKEYLIERTLFLLSDSPVQKSRIEKYKKAFNNPISINSLYMGIFNKYWDYRSEYEAYKQIKNINNNLPYYNLENLDFNSILDLAQQQGEANCTNNDFGIYNNYWTTYVEDTYKNGEIIDKVQFYTNSPEYDDFRCFLKVADELGIEVMVFSIPVNNKWYSFQGKLCDDYYKIIKEVALEYNNVTFFDMSIYADEPYFLKDIMHLGWKGWARINEVLYTEFVEKQ